MRKSVTVVLCLIAVAAHAGGPRFVAGTTYFNAGLGGTPVTWANGAIVYYTDQGDLSSLETQSTINALVAEAFSRWTSVATAALNATRGGSLDEDVSGANVVRAGSVLTMPADIQPSSTKAVAIVYDADGKVVDALLGTGASQACGSNMVVGGPDAFTADAHISHALLVLNGVCVQTATDMPLLRYRLIRAIGRVLGLGWSQLNENVVSGTPAPTMNDYDGFPVMHPSGILCTPSYGCVYNADQLRMDDRAAISRLYPVTTANVAQFAGKQIFSAVTGRIAGHVMLGDGANATPIQGINVIARRIDPATGRPSTKFGASCVSGFLFRGNAGNPITGFEANGQHFDQWGSADSSLRGYFELSGLEIPAGSTTAQYELQIEAVNAAYTGALAVGPYTTGQVSPPAMAASAQVSVVAGAEVPRDFVLQPTFRSEDPYESHSFDDPAPLPGAGDWAASVDPYGDLDWYSVELHAGRIFTIDVAALDEQASPSANKALPVIGIWAPDASATDAPVLSQTYLNATPVGVTRLHGSVVANGRYKIAIADYRGDGRPDLRYHARFLYADSVTPDRGRPEGGRVIAISGLGFAPDVSVTIGKTPASVISFTPNKLVATAPALPDGTYDLVIEDAKTGATATLPNAISYGGSSSDVLQLLQGSNPPVPVGTQAPNPFRVRVVASDNATPVLGAAVRFQSLSDAVLLLPCGTRNCIVSTDATGEALVWLAVKAAGATTVTASLSGGAIVSATVSGITPALAITPAPSKIYLAKNAAATVPLLARVVGDGTLLPGRAVEFQVMLGSATLTSTTATTDSSGEARTTLTVPNMTSEIRVSACVGSAPQIACDTFYLYAVTNMGLLLQKASGDEQWAVAGGRLNPITVRVDDLNTPSNSVAGVPVTFRATAYRVQSDPVRRMQGEVLFGRNSQLIAVGYDEAAVNSNGWGLASYTPVFRDDSAALLIQVRATAGNQQVAFTLHTWPAAANSAAQNTHAAVPRSPARLKTMPAAFPRSGTSKRAHRLRRGRK